MLIITSLAAAALASSLAAATSTTSPLPPLVITVTEMTEMPARLVPRVLEEANAIWRSAGVTFVWRRVTPQAAARIDQPPAATTALRIVIGKARGIGREDRIPLGWIQFDDGAPTREIYVSYSNAVDYLGGSESVVGIASQMTVLERETYPSRAMGRALAHELGHFLLASKDHTRRGLMQATHTASDFFDPQRHGFTIDASQRQLVAARLRQDGIVVSR
jgi:hypothetical protein